jgi:hypothetical protein
MKARFYLLIMVLMLAAIDLADSCNTVLEIIIKSPEPQAPVIGDTEVVV